MPLAPHRTAAFLGLLLLALSAPSFAAEPRITPRRTAEEQALLAIRENAVRRVQDLMARMQGMPDGPARDALERQIVGIKRESDVEFLEAKLRFARERGDDPTLHDAELQIVGARPLSTSGGCVDSLDDNNTCAVATRVIPRSYAGLMVGISPDEDWYKVNVQRNGTLTVTLNFTHASGNIDLRLYDVCGGTLLQSSVSATNQEQIIYKNTSPTRDLYLRVTMSTGSCNGYSMNVAITSTTNLSAVFVPAGWAAPLVPRNVNNSTNASVPLSATLPGNGNTYANRATNLTGDNAPANAGRTFLDDSLLFGVTMGDNSAAGLWTTLNAGPYTVRGGRHTLRQEADDDNQVIESNENDNSWSNQWVWSPLATSFHVPLVRDFPPVQGTGVYPNADGFSFTRGPSFSWVVAIAPLTLGDDYDLKVYSDYTGSTAGFSTLLDGSAASNNGIDFVVGHYNGTPTTVYAAVYRFLANNRDDYVIDASDAHLGGGSLVTTPTFIFSPVPLAANRLADVYEAYMNSGSTYYFSLRTLSGTTPIQFQIFPPTNGATWYPGQGWASTPFNVPQTLQFTAINTGWHPIVVYRRSGTDAGTELVYDFRWSNSTMLDAPEPGGTLSLAGAIPNPIRGHGRIHYVLPAAGTMSLGIYDVSGRLIRELMSGPQPAGAQSVEWNGTGADGARVGAGLYWARLRFGGQMRTQRIALVR